MISYSNPLGIPKQSLGAIARFAILGLISLVTLINLDSVHHALYKTRILPPVFLES